ncbi:MAG TPA: hypothetical protein VIH59_36940 [Candidatus Tectomicrobia bacterium]
MLNLCRDELIERVQRLRELAAALLSRQNIPVLALDHRSGNTGPVQVVLQ